MAIVIEIAITGIDADVDHVNARRQRAVRHPRPRRSIAFDHALAIRGRLHVLDVLILGQVAVHGLEPVAIGAADIDAHSAIVRGAKGRNWCVLDAQNAILIDQRIEFGREDIIRLKDDAARQIIGAPPEASLEATFVAVLHAQLDVLAVSEGRIDLASNREVVGIQPIALQGDGLGRLTIEHDLAANPQRDEKLGIAAERRARKHIL